MEEPHNAPTTSKSIEIEVRTFATLRDISGIASERLQIPSGLTIRALILQMAEKLPKRGDFFSAIFQEGEMDPHTLQKYVKVLLNGRILMAEAALDTPITVPNSVVAIFPPVGGG